MPIATIWAIASREGKLDSSTIVVPPPQMVQNMSVGNISGYVAPQVTGLLRDASGDVCGVVEHKDASAQQRSVREVASGVYAFDHEFLRAAVERLSTDNAQGEEYLPDVVDYEEGALTETEIRQLRAMGHALKEGGRQWGNMQVITWDYASGKVDAASDPRGEGEGLVY